MAERLHDVVLLGATGFTGRQAARWFLEHAGERRWAIAGRSEAGLRALRSALGVPDLPFIVTDVHDAGAVDRMARATRVVASTAGPFSVLGTPVVEACVRQGTHYVDISGETAWAQGLVDRFHETARKNGTRIVPSCGFDSVPSDLGAWMVVGHLRDAFGEATRSVRACFRVRGGGWNGGTLATTRLLLADPGRRRWGVSSNKAERDPDLGRWTAPFVMEPVNRAVVYRSASLHAERGLPYGPGFSYSERMVVRGPVRAELVALGLAAADRAPARLISSLIGAFGPKPGQGPSEARMTEGSFHVDLFAVGEGGTKARGIIESDGDAGNRSTVRMLGASALCLLEEGLPGEGGILTPAIAFGADLMERLQRLPMRFEVLA